jgi:hypothetical protein
MELQTLRVLEVLQIQFTIQQRTTSHTKQENLYHEESLQGKNVHSNDKQKYLLGEITMP